MAYSMAKTATTSICSGLYLKNITRKVNWFKKRPCHVLKGNASKSSAILRSQTRGSLELYYNVVSCVRIKS